MESSIFPAREQRNILKYFISRVNINSIIIAFFKSKYILYILYSQKLPQKLISEMFNVFLIL